jgi:hypothetical protein
VGRHVGQEIEGSLGAVVELDDTLGRIHLLDLVLRVVGDVLALHHAAHGLGQLDSGRHHGTGLGGVQIHRRAITQLALAQVVLDEHRRLIRRGGALVARCRGQHHHLAPLEGRERLIQGLGSCDGVEVVAGLGQAGDSRWGQIRTEGDDEVVGDERLVAHLDAAVLGINALDLAANDFDAFAIEPGERAGDLLRAPLANHHPQQGGSEHVLLLSIHQDNPMLGRQPLAQLCRRDQSTHSATEHHRGSARRLHQCLTHVPLSLCVCF